MWGWWCGDGMVEECLGFPYGKFVGMIAIGEWLKKTQTIHLLQNWFGANVLVSLNHMEFSLDLRRKWYEKIFAEKAPWNGADTNSLLQIWNRGEGGEEELPVSDSSTPESDSD